MDLLRISFSGDGGISLTANLWMALALLLVLVALVLAFRWLRNTLFRDEYEIDRVELGIGSGKVTLKPNNEDLQIAYRLWVELKTRKLGLPFDEDHDVIVEVYNSWYEFFRITRELIKTVPVAKVRDQSSTQLLVGISIDVLNKAIRPHLTKWQARYRHWYEFQLQRGSNPDISPQDLQKQYPEYKSLVSELKKVNAQLVAYSNMLASLLELKPNTWRAT